MPTTTEKVPFAYRGKRLTYHPLCLAFPLMTDEELQELARDIKQRNRLLQSVVIYRGKILDGRNRLNACQIAGVKPTFVQWDGTGSLTAWVIAANMNRRHLTSSQRAVIALELLPMLEAEAKERQRLSGGRGVKGAKSLTGLNGRATEIAARMTGSNFLYVSNARSIREQAPELIEEVRTGRLSLAEVKPLAGLPKSKRNAVLRQVRQGQSVGEVLGSCSRHSNDESVTHERYTPPAIAGKAREVLEKIDLDPATSKAANKTIMAKAIFTKATNGLKRRWRGRVFLNPPFDNLPKWLAKLNCEMEAGRVKEAIVVGPANLSLYRSLLLKGGLLCVPEQRPKYFDPHAKKWIDPPFGTLICYIGKRHTRFKKVFGEQGLILKRV